MKIIATFFTVACLFDAVQAQQKNPCNDSLYLRLKSVPRVSLTQSERKYIDQKEQECANFKASSAAPKIDTRTTQPTLPDAARDSARTDEPKDAKKTDAQPVQQPTTTDSEKQTPMMKADSLLLKQEAENEPILSGRNIGIFAVILAAIVGIAVALGGVTPAPF